ncbi:VOC family protein [Curtobacterium sp. VKM Ac-2922]|uniref:VOC family protein n=1 Tax=Curtobacterium sp. VKM Ac-2922 TaxID=2929475 RepID=UPI001FB42C7C|nr:VOC family protein [Curtobacterium sp. VKM Ac-2922]MCJ1714592.1 VOC family protein [Curtobacterium sp. VKM Ac-2922]
MATGVAAVWVPVTDMARAVAFYRDTLGLEVTSQDDDWSEIDANGLRIGLNARESASASSDGGAVVSFQPDGSIEDEVATLKQRGADIQGEISEHPWGKIVPFKDSEGNDLQLYAPPTS